MEILQGRSIIDITKKKKARRIEILRHVRRDGGRGRERSTVVRQKRLLCNVINGKGWYFGFSSRVVFGTKSSNNDEKLASYFN